jgi:hypothetical protein
MYEVLAIQLTKKAFAFEQFSLSDIMNARVTSEWLGDAKEVSDLGQATLFRRFTVEDGQPVEYFFAVDGEGLTRYCVKVADIKAPPLRAGCQVGVWSDPEFATPVRFAPKVFWEVLFERHDIISDQIQTDFGRRFWINRIGEAYGKNLCVYLLELRGSKIIKSPRIRTVDDFNKMITKIWGSELKMRNIRLAITKNPLRFE